MLEKMVYLCCHCTGLDEYVTGHHCIFFVLSGLIFASLIWHGLEEGDTVVCDFSVSLVVFKHFIYSINI